MKKGMKYDTNKPQYNLLPLKEHEEVIKVLTAGAKKYAPENWKYVPDAKNRYYSATMRHINAYFMGEVKDPETGLSHLSHAQCCLYFLQWLENNKENIQ
jgi:hypothetical protein